VPAATALQRRGQRLCNDLFPLAKADEDRRKLEQLIGADRSITADMQTNLAIFGPLLISAATALLSP
jgi:hypothetical protein